MSRKSDLPVPEDTVLASPEKSPWNSLELTKVVVAALVPLTTAILAAAVAWATNEANSREQLRLATEAHNQAIRLQADEKTERDREAASREAAAKAERLAREREARVRFNQEMQLAKEAAQREVAMQARLRQEAFYSQVIQKRWELWEKLGPIITEIHSESTSHSLNFAGDAGHNEKLNELILEMERLKLQYSDYFSRDFVAAVNAYQLVDGLESTIDLYAKEQRLRSVVRRELGLTNMDGMKF